MKFENQYLTYEEYKKLGGSINEMPFNLLEFEVRKILDGRTQGRLLKINNEEMPQEVKLCVNKMINTITNYINSSVENKIVNGGIVASENTDGYSVSYVTAYDALSKGQDIIKSKQVELEDIMRNYLNGMVVDNVPVLYLGVI